MFTRTALVLCTVGLTAAIAADGPSTIMKAAEQAAYADTLIQSCHYDEAEHWIDKALHAARDTRSDSSLVRDTAGTFVGHLEIKVREFREQRKSWSTRLRMRATFWLPTDWKLPASGLNKPAHLRATRAFAN